MAKPRIMKRATFALLPVQTFGRRASELAFLDHEDIEWAHQYDWRIDRNGDVRKISERITGRLLKCRLLKPDEGRAVAILNGEPTDLRRRNLRLLDREGLKLIARLRCQAAPKFQIVKAGGLFGASLVANGRVLRAGLHKTELDAIAAAYAKLTEEIAAAYLAAASVACEAQNPKPSPFMRRTKKKCFACGEVKALTDFRKDPTQRLGVSIWCTECFKSNSQKRRNARDKGADGTRTGTWRIPGVNTSQPTASKNSLHSAQL